VPYAVKHLLSGHDTFFHGAERTQTQIAVVNLAVEIEIVLDEVNVCRIHHLCPSNTIRIRSGSAEGSVSAFHLNSQHVAAQGRSLSVESSKKSLAQRQERSRDRRGNAGSQDPPLPVEYVIVEKLMVPLIRARREH